MEILSRSQGRQINQKESGGILLSESYGLAFPTYEDPGCPVECNWKSIMAGASLCVHCLCSLLPSTCSPSVTTGKMPLKTFQ